MPRAAHTVVTAALASTGQLCDDEVRMSRREGERTAVD
jgi:hypothetical protein